MIGNGQTGSRTFDGYIDDVRIYDYIRSSKLLVSDMNAGHPAVGSPIASAVGHWKFDEGYGTAAHNSGNCGSTCDGTLSGGTIPTWNQSGKFQKALSFNGSTAYVSVADTAALDITGDISISAWANPTSLDSAYHNILFKGTTTNNTTRQYGLRLTNTNIWQGYLDIGSSEYAVACSASAATAGQWAHIVFTRSGANAALYVNGVKKCTSTAFGTGSINSTSNILAIGKIGAANTEYFNGSIDEDKIYNYLLSDDEVKLDYNQAKSQVMGAVSTASDGITADNSAAREYCVPGDTATCSAPIGEWKLDENTGTTAYDTSGNGRNGTLTATKTTPWVPGKYGSGVNLDNTHDYITVADNNAFSVNTTNKLSVMGWVKFDTLGATSEPFNKGQGSNYEWAYRVFSDGSIRAFIFTSSGGNYLTTSQSAAGIITTGQWYHLAMTVDTTAPLLSMYVNGRLISTSSSTAGSYTNGTASVRFGEREDVANGTDGTIDNVRIYDYARTPAQIAWDYNRGGPVGWWKFDEGQGTTVYDASENGLNGVLNNGPTWVDGKYNGALSFDNNDDFIGSLNDNHDMGTSDFTISAWMKRTDHTSGNVVIAKKNGGSNTQPGWALYCTNSASCTFYLADNSNNQFTISAVIPSAGQWIHLAVVLNRASNSNSKFYVNGVDVTSSRSGTISSVTSVDNALNLRIGSYSNSSNVFNGSIDDVRIYKYTLTEKQVKTVYGNGALYFGPATGSP